MGKRADWNREDDEFQLSGALQTFFGDVYQLLGNVNLDLTREITDRDIDVDSGIIMKEETGEIRGNWARGTEPKGISLRSGKERGSCKQN